MYIYVLSYQIDIHKAFELLLLLLLLLILILLFSQLLQLLLFLFLFSLYLLFFSSNNIQVRNEFYKDTQGAILVYDVGDRGSFEALDYWMEEISNEIGNRAEIDNIVFCVCANKVLFCFSFRVYPPFFPLINSPSPEPPSPRSLLKIKKNKHHFFKAKT